MWRRRHGPLSLQQTTCDRPLAEAIPVALSMTTHRDSLIAAMVIFLLVDTVVLGARVFVRTRLLRGSFGRDDFVLCLTYVSASSCRPCSTSIDMGTCR